MFPRVKPLAVVVVHRTRTSSFPSTTMHASLARRQLGSLIPPKVATPRSLVRISLTYPLVMTMTYVRVLVRFVYLTVILERPTFGPIELVYAPCLI